MKIFQIINSAEMGGAEKLVADMIPLMQKNADVDVLYLKDKNTPLRASVESETNGSVFTLSAGSVYNPMHVFRIRKYLKKYDIVHVHLFPALYWTAFAKIISGAKTPLVYTEHSTHNKRRENPIFKILDRFVYRQYKAIATISPEVDAALKQHLKAKSEKFTTITNGISLENFRSANPYSKDDFFSADDKILIQVSSFRYPKDQLTVIRALADLPSGVKLLLVGEGPLKQECQDEVSRLNLSDRVKFLGNRMDVPRLLKTADAVLLSSNYEGLSLSSLEGMASGKPFVASDAPGLATTVKNAGLLFPIGDSSLLAQLINRLFSDNDFHDSTVAACQRRAAQYDLQNTVAHYFKLYENVR